MYLEVNNYSKILCLCGLFLLINCKHQTTIEIVENDIAPISIKGLQNRSYEAQLRHEKKLIGTIDYNSNLMSYYSDSLKIYALINAPAIEEPKNGFPVMIFGHGFHPEPLKYGVSNKTGEDWRPGDYYRGIPESYAKKGFLTITPDYRGHNVSDGFKYTKTSYLASTYYAVDVLHLVAAIQKLENVDLSNIYYMGHSMGGDVGLKVLLATDKIKAASLWSAVSASTPEQAIYYGKWSDKNWDNITDKSMQNYMAQLDSTIQNLGFNYDVSSGDPIHFIDEIYTPIIIHHATDETSVPYRWSESLAAKLYENKKDFRFYSYESENHLFKGANRIKAVERDIEFFEKYNKH